MLFFPKKCSPEGKGGEPSSCGYQLIIDMTEDEECKFGKCSNSLDGISDPVK